MTEFERQLLVGALFAIVLGIRLLAHREAGGLFRDQSDGLRREGGWFIGIMVRVVFLIGGLVGLAAWVVSPSLVPGSVAIPPWGHGVGLVLLETGILLLVWVHLALGVHFSGTLHLRDDHRLVRRGPYARIRHPMYTSFLLIFGGLTLLTSNVLLGGLWLASQLWVLGWRLPQEERSLQERFGAQWHNYHRQTGVLTPWW
ncbi:MAG: isoprenylcysteine carboxylmethyltransferase family protein [Myxococcota bacterium]